MITSKCLSPLEFIVNNLKKIERLIKESIEKIELNLSDLTILTETGSNNFVLTSLIASFANASQVFAVTRDSSYGMSSDIIEYSKSIANGLNLNNIDFNSELPESFASKSDIVTNLGFVRPISSSFIKKLPKHAVISLMWEPWEFRHEDIDIRSAKNNEILVLGTKETDPRLRTFEYVGILAVKLLLEKDIEIIDSNILIVGTNPFAEHIGNVLSSLKANCSIVKPNNEEPLSLETLNFKKCDAIVVAENRYPLEIIGNKSGSISPVELKDNAIELIHICGNIDEQALSSANISKHPSNSAGFGYMTKTTDYVGPKPLIDLHCAGLRVGEVSVRERIEGKSIEIALKKAMDTGLCLPLEI